MSVLPPSLAHTYAEAKKNDPNFIIFNTQEVRTKKVRTKKVRMVNGERKFEGN